MNPEPRQHEDYQVQQVVEFYHSQQSEEQGMQARRAFELVRKFLSLIEPDYPHG